MPNDVRLRGTIVHRIHRPAMIAGSIEVTTFKGRARRIIVRFVARALFVCICLWNLAAEARPFWRFDGIFASPSRALAESHVPHPSVARIIVPERDGTAYGSGTLVDVRDDFGLVLTNHHVVEYASGPIEVAFPSGYRSKARSIKVDAQWDLAALVIWRPEKIEPVKLATRAPRPGDVLTICGYGQGQYRSITGRCTDYYAPSVGLPREWVELDVEARQGDSGGPIFNDQNQLAGVLFGAGQGTTLGSYEGRVKGFLATIAPDIGTRKEKVIVATAEGEKPMLRKVEPDSVNSQSEGFAVWQPAETKSSQVTQAAAHESNPVGPSELSRDGSDDYLAVIPVLVLAAFFLAFVRMVK